MSALRRRGGELALLQKRGALSTASALRADAVAVAAHIRARHQEPMVAAESLRAGLDALNAGVRLFAASPPRIDAGVHAVAHGLLNAVEAMLPASVTSTADFNEFGHEWMSAFAGLPSMVQSIPEDLRAFGKDGAEDRLVRAMNAFLLEAAALMSGTLPEQLGDWIAAYLGALADAFDGVGDGMQALAQNNESEAIEAVYRGLEAATKGIASPEAQSEAMLQTAVDVLDPIIGNLSKNMLEYKKLVAESTVCWRAFARRARQRPQFCEEGYSWDGDQWCKVSEGVVSLEHSARAKRPHGALPARCPRSHEKRGSWCYEVCEAGYEPSGPQCKGTCGGDFPIEAPMMCGTSPGTIQIAITRMVAETIARVVTIGGLVGSMKDKGMSLAAGLTGTMQTLIDMGKPFAHPRCPT